MHSWRQLVDLIGCVWGGMDEANPARCRCHKFPQAAVTDAPAPATATPPPPPRTFTGPPPPHTVLYPAGLPEGTPAAANAAASSSLQKLSSRFSCVHKSASPLLQRVKSDQAGIREAH